MGEPNMSSSKLIEVSQQMVMRQNLIFFRSKSRSDYLQLPIAKNYDNDDDEKSEWSIDRNPLDPVPVNVVKYDDMNGDIPALDKGTIAEIEMHQMEQSTQL